MSVSIAHKKYEIETPSIQLLKQANKRPEEPTCIVHLLTYVLMFALKNIFWDAQRAS